MANLVIAGKTGLVYFTQLMKFYTVKNNESFEELLSYCSQDDISKIDNKTGYKKKLQKESITLPEQLTLNISDGEFLMKLLNMNRYMIH